MYSLCNTKILVGSIIIIQFYISLGKILIIDSFFTFKYYKKYKILTKVIKKILSII